MSSTFDGVMMPEDVTLCGDVVSGVWKFPRPITLKQVIALAREWRDGPEGQNYLRIKVRACSRGEWGIDFEYRFSEKNHKSYFYRIRAQFENLFDERITWDMGEGTIYVKTDDSYILYIGTRVKTTQPDPHDEAGWPLEALKARKWGVTGKISDRHHHGSFYVVEHDDGSAGCYNRVELETITT